MLRLQIVESLDPSQCRCDTIAPRKQLLRQMASDTGRRARDEPGLGHGEPFLGGPAGLRRHTAR